MASIKKIAIISTHSFGYIDFLVNLLNESESVDLTYIDIDSIPFRYKNFGARIINFFKKTFLGSSLKEKNRTNFIKKSLIQGEKFDQTLIIRPDKLESEALAFLRENSTEMTCYLFDGIENFNNQKNTLPFFDTVYSYDKVDVEKYNFKFLTNFIYDNTIEKAPITNLAFAIFSYDIRFPIIEKVANFLSANKTPFHFIVKKNKLIKHDKIDIVADYLQISEVKKYISGSLALVDIQFENQHGLSFRVFEALGYNKKLITTNHDIVNYDFYNPNNICVISGPDYEIPLSFFETEYVTVDSDVVNNYHLKTWIEKVFKINIC